MKRKVTEKFLLECLTLLSELWYSILDAPDNRAGGTVQSAGRCNRLKQQRPTEQRCEPMSTNVTTIPPVARRDRHGLPQIAPDTELFDIPRSVDASRVVDELIAHLNTWQPGDPPALSIVSPGRHALNESIRHLAFPRYSRNGFYALLMSAFGRTKIGELTDNEAHAILSVLELQDVDHMANVLPLEEVAI